MSELRAHRDVRGHDDLTRTYDAFMLDPGLGPPVYLTTDGRVVWDDDIWGVTGTRAEALASTFAGIQKTGIGRLRDLLPARLSDAVDCANCRATGRFDADGNMVDVHGRHFSVICMTCAGVGWLSPSLRLEEIVLDAG